MKKNRLIQSLLFSCLLLSVIGLAQILSSCGLQSKGTNISPEGLLAKFDFDGNFNNTAGSPITDVAEGKVAFVNGLDGQAFNINRNDQLASLTLSGENLKFDKNKDFSVQFWVKTTVNSDEPFVILSQKEFPDNSVASQKNLGWVFYMYEGTWAWSMGSGKRRISYLRDNGARMPLNDGRWHQLTMTYNSASSELGLFYDGQNKVFYNMNDDVGFDFTSSAPVTIGWKGAGVGKKPEIHPLIEEGAENLQKFVDQFNSFGLSKVNAEEFVHMIVDPKNLFEKKVNEMAKTKAAKAQSLKYLESAEFESISEIERLLMKNPYTVHQSLKFMGAAPLLKIYSLVDGRVVINESTAKDLTKKQILNLPDMAIDNLRIWERTLGPEEVLRAYSQHFEPAIPKLEERATSITAASWNIYHGGIHYSMEDDGWDGRIAIAEMLKKENVDVIMMQETYSSGDFIAAELGYYFATTVDWDNMNQGSNVSVISRFPIRELYVPPSSPFMNVTVKVALSETQDMWVMSNWYGMRQFQDVFDFNKTRIMQSDIPILFAGDFNAVPHTDGGESPASRKLLEAGFTDSFRSLYPDVENYPGGTRYHPDGTEGRRIDQLYYKGAGLKNTSSNTISVWPAGYPSDHLMIKATFDLDYSSGS